MSEPTVYRINDSSLGGERVLNTQETLRLEILILDRALVPVKPDYESGVKTAATVMGELDNFEAAIIAGIAAALERVTDDA